MQLNKPYYIAPLLVEQPTWGGDYIAQNKSISQPKVTTKKIGQAFELAKESMLVENPSKDFLLTSATLINQSEHIGDSKLHSLQSVIDQNPSDVLGKAVVKKHGPVMPVLIKFTQAKSNSYQVHLKQGVTLKHWLPKPESWYFFEKGKATLCLNTSTKVEEYKLRCQEIYDRAQQISQQIKQKEISLKEAQQRLDQFINQDHPHNYVTTIYPEADSIIDLSEGGIHHSWETDPQLKNGNIVYEVQLDVQDEFCTLRSFDQGKFKDDGSIRNLTIDDYFQALETDPQLNDPALYQQPATSTPIQNGHVTVLFDSPNYHLSKLVFDTEHSSHFTSTVEGFHHLFVKQGSGVKIVINQESYPLDEGWSLFIPAAVKNYTLIANKKATILKTTA